MKHTTRMGTRGVLALLLWLSILNASAQTSQMALGYRRALNTDWIGYNGQNMIRDSIGWSNPYLMKNLPLLQPKNLRYPGGGLSNFWDWHKGWFVNSPMLPPAYQGLTQLPNTLENFKKVLDSCHANAILVVNMITSTLKDQVAMLKHADSIGIKVKYVELGNEFYLDGGDDSVAIMSVFPTAQSYAAAASTWCDTIHKYFPSAKVAAQGAYNRNNATRRITWDENMLPTLHGEDVISYHAYMSAAAADEAYTDTSTFTAADLPEMLFRPFKMWQILSTEDIPLIPTKDQIWITEYNLRDKTRPSQGCWAHGLFTATQTMQFFNDSRITRVTCHSMDGTAVDGALFFNANAYDYGNAGNFIPPPNPPASTQYWGKSACGATMQLLGVAIKNMTYASPLEFYATPLLTTTDNGDTVTYPAIYGWEFNNNDSTQVVVVNLSSTDRKIKTQYIFPAGGRYERYSADPLLYVSRDADLTHKVNASLPAGTFTLPAYSITRMFAHIVPAVPPASNTITANGATTFCEGDSVQLNAGSGYVYYLWSTGDTSQKIWAKKDGDYWVRVRTVVNGYWVADTIHVTVHAKPVQPAIANFPVSAFCSGDHITLSVKFPDNALTYSWSNGGSGTSINAVTGGNYTVTATDVNGCKSTSTAATLTMYSLPQPVMTSSGPTEFCWDASVTLDAGAGYKSYAWSNGKVGESITVTSSGSYSCTVKDNNNCYGTTQIQSVTVHTPADPVVTITGPTTFCDGTSPTYLQANSGYNYQWQKGGVDIAGATSKKYYPVQDGNFRVILSDTYGCSKKSSSTSITVNKLPKTKITVTGSKKICVPLETTKLSSETCTGCGYQWKLAGLNIIGATTKTYTAALAGDFSYQVTDNNSCSATSSTVTIINTCKEEATVSEDSLAIEPSIKVYPNPANEMVHVLIANLGNATEGTIVIRNILGEALSEQTIQIEGGTASFEMMTDALPAGLYLFTLKTGTVVLSRQVTIERK